jgi:hypothetical protein
MIALCNLFFNFNEIKCLIKLKYFVFYNRILGLRRLCGINEIDDNFTKIEEKEVVEKDLFTSFIEAEEKEKEENEKEKAASLEDEQVEENSVKISPLPLVLCVDVETKE